MRLAAGVTLVGFLFAQFHCLGPTAMADPQSKFKKGGESFGKNTNPNHGRQPTGTEALAGGGAKDKFSPENTKDEIIVTLKPICSTLSTGKFVDANYANGGSSVSGSGDTKNVVTYILEEPVGGEGTIDVEDRILFRHSWSHSACLEAQIHCTGEAKDILGHPHHFKLDVNASGGQSVEREKQSGWSVTVGVSGGGESTTSASGGGRKKVSAEVAKKVGVSANASVTFGSETVTNSSSSQAPGDSDSDLTTLTVPDSLTGTIPLTYTSQEITAKVEDKLAGRAFGGESNSASDDSATTITLDHFDVEHAVQAKFTTTVSVPAAPGYPAPETWVPYVFAYAPLTGHQQATLPAGMGGCFAGFVTSPEGLDGQVGEWVGSGRVYLDAPQTEDVTFELTSTPTGCFQHPATVTILEGRDFVDFELKGLQSASNGSLAIEARDLEGDPSGQTITLSCAASSISAYSTTKIRATFVGSGRALEGTQAGILSVGRRGYSSIETQSTTISLSYSDPNCILGSTPPTLVIPAGSADQTMPITLASASGVATITLTCGSYEQSFTVESQAQAWAPAMTTVRIPAGALARVPLRTKFAEASSRSFTITSAATQIATLSTEMFPMSFPDGSNTAVYFLSGEGAGTTSLTTTSAGLPNLTTTVQVVAPEVACTRTSWTLSSASGSSACTLELSAPPGTTFATFNGPTGSGAYLTVTGVGTGTILIEFTGGARPSQIVGTMTLNSAPSGAFRLGVVDSGLHPAQLINYSVLVD